MPDIQMGLVESQFADIIWANEPIKTSELVKIAEADFTWKRTTTHTVIKRLCEKGLFVNNKGTVTSIISRDEFYSMQSRQFVENSFKGSLPAFIAEVVYEFFLTKSLVYGLIVSIGIFLYLGHGLSAYASLRLVYDPQHGYIVSRVFDEPEICHHILYFFSVVVALSCQHPVRKPSEAELFFEAT